MGEGKKKKIKKVKNIFLSIYPTQKIGDPCEKKVKKTPK
jgi:hypothetical protein